jgi:uncharacterized membrane protein YkoI
MKINRFLALALIALLIVSAMGVLSYRAYAQTPPTDGDDTSEVGESEANDTDDANEGPDVPITGTALEQASAAALEYIGEGRVTETEVGDEEGYYEVEITKDNGREVDVHLDEAFNVLGHEND